MLSILELESTCERYEKLLDEKKNEKSAIRKLEQQSRSRDQQENDLKSQIEELKKQVTKVEREKSQCEQDRKDSNKELQHLEKLLSGWLSRWQLAIWYTQFFTAQNHTLSTEY